MSRFKFRAWHIKNNRMVYFDKEDQYQILHLFRLMNGTHDEDGILEQCTGLKDKNGKLIYCGDICEFDNGDRFVIKCEEWLEFYVEWIGEPECEDQARDFYRIARAVVIGNIHENEDLLK